MTTMLPMENRPIQLTPEVREPIEAMIARYEGEEQEIARCAVLKVYHSGHSGDFHAIIDRYREEVEGDVERHREAIEEAVV